MRVLVFDGYHTGHSLAFVRHILLGLNDLPVRTTVVLPSAAPKSPPFAVHLAPFLNRVDLVPVIPETPVGAVARAAFLAHHLRLHVRRSRPDHVLVPNGDGLAQFLGIASRVRNEFRATECEFETLILRGAFAYTGLPIARSAFHRLAIHAVGWGPWNRVHFLDRIAFRRARTISERLRAISRLMPDPVDVPAVSDRAKARMLLGVPPGGRIVSIAGALDRRKGIDLLLRAFASARLRPDDRLLLVGPILPDVRPVLEASRRLMDEGRIIVVDRYVSDVEFDAAIAAADVVCAPYPRHVGSASLVIRAAAAGRPVLGADYGFIGHSIRDFSLGTVCRPGDVESIALALPIALDQAASFTPSSRAQAFVGFHTVGRFQGCWLSRIRERLGLPASTGAAANEVDAGMPRDALE